MRHARSGVVEVQLLRRPLGQKVAAGPECWHEALRTSTCRSNSTARRSLGDNDKWPRSDAPIFFIVGASASGGAILGPGRGPHGDLERGSLSDFVPSPRKTRRVLVPMARPKAQDNPPKRFKRVKSHLENDIAGLGPPGTWCIPGGERPTQIDRHRSRSGRISAKFGCGSRVMMCADRLVRFREKTDRSPVEKNRDLEMGRLLGRGGRRRGLASRLVKRAASRGLHPLGHGARCHKFWVPPTPNFP